MISTQTLSKLGVTAADCSVVAQATFRATPDEIAALRKSPDPSGTFTVHPSLLRHADEQTVVGLAGVFEAIRGSGLDGSSFGDWGVLAAPRYHGRAAFERAFPTFQAEGAWGVSPHLIPAHSLHSPSGTISQALQAHGPNLGVGGTPAGGREALLSAATWLLGGLVPGVWVVLTGRETERDGTGPAGDYEALVLALTPFKTGNAGSRIRISPVTIEMSQESSLEMTRWLVPGFIRVDQGQSQGAIRPPHRHPNRASRPGGSGDRK